MTSAITRLWLTENLPIRDALYRSDGSAREVRVDDTAFGGLALLQPFDIEAFLAANPDELTSVIMMLERELPDDSGYLCCGEGSYGSEGFFGRLDQHRRLVWVVYLEYSNPFIQVNIDGTWGTFTSSSGVSITVDLASSEFGPG